MTKRHWTLGTKIWVLLGLSWLVGVGATGYVLHSQSKTAAAFDTLLRDSSKNQRLARITQVSFKKQVQEWKNILLRGHDSSKLQKHLAGFRNEHQVVQESASALVRSTEKHPEIQRLASNFLSAHVRMGQSYEQALKIFLDSGGTAYKEADLAVNGQDRAPTDLIDELAETAARQEANQSAAIRATVLQVIGALVIAFAVLVSMSVVFVRRTNSSLRAVVQQLRGSAHHVAEASGLLSNASGSLAAGATEEASSLEETSASCEEINSMAKQNATIADQATALVTESRDKFDQATEVLSGVVESMKQIGDSSRQVSTILKVIDEIAFQTNLLALNAAVEAARAGEAGMGFAVVADEVRRLAQRCADASRETATLVSESLAKSAEGNTKVTHMTEVIGEVTQHAAALKTLVESVNQGSREQTQGMEQIARALVQIETVVQRTAAGAEESAATSTELARQSASLSEVVVNLAAMVGAASS